MPSPSRRTPEPPRRRARTRCGSTGTFSTSSSTRRDFSARAKSSRGSRRTTVARAHAAPSSREFLQAHVSDARFHDERELLRPIVEGAGILYVVDGSRPYGRQYEAEMEILRWTGRPRMALINTDRRRRSRRAMARCAGAIFFDRARVRRRARGLRQTHRAPALVRRDRRALGRAVERRRGCARRRPQAPRAPRRRRDRGSVDDALTATVTVPLASRSAEREAEALAEGRAKLRDQVRRARLRREGPCRRSIITPGSRHASRQPRISSRTCSRHKASTCSAYRKLSWPSPAQRRAPWSAAPSTWRSAVRRYCSAPASAPCSARSARSRAREASRRRACSGCRSAVTSLT